MGDMGEQLAARESIHDINDVQADFDLDDVLIDVRDAAFSYNKYTSEAVSVIKNKSVKGRGTA